MGPACGRDAERRERWSRRANRIEHGDSPACSLPIPVRKAHCSLSGVALFPVVPNSVAGACEPFLVAPKLLQDSGWEELCAIPGAMAERSQEACRRVKVCSYLASKS